MNNYLRNKIDVIEIDFPGEDIVYEEDFEGNTYDSSLWTLFNDGSVTQFLANNNRLEGTFGCCINDNVNYDSYQFYLTTLSEPNTNIDIRGKAWKASITGNRASAIGFWNAANYYVLISPDNVFGNSGEVTLLIRNGDSGTGGGSTFTYLQSVALDPTIERAYRITYNRSNNEIKFFYDNAGTWTQIGTTQVVDFGAAQFRVGAFQGIFNTSGGGTTYNDDLEVFYTPEGGTPTPEIITYKFISTDIPIQIANRYYGYKPLIKSVNDIPAEIREKDTVTRRLKVTCIDTLELVSSTSTQMASFWRMFIALRKNYRGREIRYYRRLGEGELQLRFVGKVENITLDSKGNTTIEAIDLLKALSKVDYPFLSGLTLAEDLIGFYIANDEESLTALSQAVPGEYSVSYRRTMQWEISVGSGSGTIPVGTYYFWVVAYNNLGEAIDATESVTEVPIGPLINGEIILQWSTTGYDASAVTYKVFGFTSALEYELASQSGNNYHWPGTTGTTSVLPEEVYRLRKLKVGGVYSNADDWELQLPNTPDFSVDIEGDISLLNDSGYLMIDEEIIYYDHILSDSEGYTLTGILRGQFGTESPRHDEGTVLYYIIGQAEPIDIFEMARLILLFGGIDEAYIDDIFETYAALNILNVTCQPIIKKEKLSDIYFDLINLADAMSFQNEEGMIEVLLHSSDPVEEVLLTDEAHLIQGSVSLDLNEESRLTRWILFWNRFNLDENLDSNDAYGRGNITIDDDQEEYYDGVEQDIQHTAFLNGELTAEITDASDYANDLLFSRRSRTREAQWLLTASLEIKDDIIKLGQIVFIKTRNVLASDGTIPTLTYRVIKKEPSANKIKFVFKRMIQDSSTES